MNEENVVEQSDNSFPEKNELIAWVKAHKKQLLLTGISVSTLIMTILGIKNKDAINTLWKSLIEEIEKGPLYSAKWFSKATLEELHEHRKIIMQDNMNPNLDNDYRTRCRNLLPLFDNAIGRLQWAGKEIEFPVHSSNGWHLPSDD